MGKKHILLTPENLNRASMKRNVTFDQVTIYGSFCLPMCEILNAESIYYVDGDKVKILKQRYPSKNEKRTSP